MSSAILQALAWDEGGFFSPCVTRFQVVIFIYFTFSLGNAFNMYPDDSIYIVQKNGFIFTVIKWFKKNAVSYCDGLTVTLFCYFKASFETFQAFWFFSVDIFHAASRSLQEDLMSFRRLIVEMCKFPFFLVKYDFISHIRKTSTYIFCMFLKRTRLL